MGLGQLAAHGRGPVSAEGLGHRGQRRLGPVRGLEEHHGPALVAAEEEAGATRKEAILDVARRAGLPKRVVYDAVHKPQEPSA